MSTSMDYGDWPDEEAKRFARAVAREKREIQRNRTRRQFPLWQRCIAALIMATALWLVGEVALYENAHIKLPRPVATRSAWDHRTQSAPAPLTRPGAGRP